MKKNLLYLLLVFAIMIIPFGVNAGTTKILGEEYETKNFIETLDDEGLEKQFTNYEEGNDKINIYLFRGKGCGFCRAFLTFMDSITEEYGKYFNMVSFEVWNNENNWYLFNRVSYFKDNEIAQGVPYIIIGDKVFGGYSNTYDEDIKKAITDLYNTPKKERYDILAEVEDKGLISIEELQKLYPADDGSNGTGEVATTGSSSSCNELAIILWTLGFVVVGTTTIIIFTNYKFNKLSKEIKKINKSSTTPAVAKKKTK